MEYIFTGIGLFGFITLTILGVKHNENIKKMVAINLKINELIKPKGEK